MKYIITLLIVLVMATSAFAADNKDFYTNSPAKAEDHSFMMNSSVKPTYDKQGYKNNINEVRVHTVCVKGMVVMISYLTADIGENFASQQLKNADGTYMMCE